MKPLVVALISIFSATAAVAENWVSIGDDVSSNKFYLDSNSLKIANGYVSVWIKELYHVPFYDNYYSKNVSYTLDKYVLDCSSDSYKYNAELSYEASGALISQNDLDINSQKWKSIAPNSISSAMENHACRLAFPSKYITPHVINTLLKDGKWNFIATSSDGTSNFFVNDKSVADLGDGIKVFVVQEALNSPKNNVDGSAYRYEYNYEVGNCNNTQLGYLSLDDTNDSGEVVYSSYIDVKNVKMISMPPGSIGEITLNTVCSSKNIAKSKDSNNSSTSYSTGTGWMSPKGYVVTASHVVQGAESLELAQDGKIVGTATVVADDPVNDVAILRPALSGASYVAIRLSGGPARLGERVFTMGYPAPDEMGLTLKVTSGEVSALAGNDVVSQRVDDIRLMQISTPIQSGNSGGPLIDEAGFAVGIILSKKQISGAEEIAQNVNYSLKISYVENLLNPLDDIGGYSLVSSVKSQVEAVESLRRGVFLIIAKSNNLQ